MRTFVVKTEANGREFHETVEARDSFEATHVAMKRNKNAFSAVVVRELKCTCADLDGFVDCPIHI